LLPADDAFAEPLRKPDRAARRLLARLRGFFDSAVNPSDSTAGDCEAGTFRFSPVCIPITLESLESAFFFLHWATIFNIDGAASPRGLPVFHDCLFLQRP
jgi:hypothetical protein